MALKNLELSLTCRFHHDFLSQLQIILRNYLKSPRWKNSKPDLVDGKQAYSRLYWCRYKGLITTPRSQQRLRQKGKTALPNLFPLQSPTDTKRNTHTFNKINCLQMLGLWEWIMNPYDSLTPLGSAHPRLENTVLKGNLAPSLRVNLNLINRRRINVKNQCPENYA